MESRVIPRNEHAIDRILRIVVGIGLLAVAFVGPKTPWGYLGVLPLLTGLAGFCPGYRLFGINTCPKDNC
ncbi:MAG: DUF2892 domain-containing protein [Gemmatimonadales bacterium]|jgi:hypothetical protein